MIKEKIGYSYNDLTILPAMISRISSRSECDPFINDNFLPIFTAPMASVVNCNNMDSFIDNGIAPIVPRNISLEERIKEMNEQQWVALSLKEFEELFIINYKDRVDDFRTHYFICVDIANGHMESLYKKCIEAKNIANAYNYKLTIMTGNIANAETYKWICNNCYIKDELGRHICCIDYIRVGIGGGSGCITTSNVSIHYPQASLIDECHKVKTELSNISLYNNPFDENNKKYVNLPKIIADGGIRNYDHVIKALALGADYVMIGSVFAQCIESAGVKSNKEVNQKIQLRFPIERYKDFEIDAKGNWWAYYTNEAIENLSKSWKIEYKKYETVDTDNFKLDYKNLPEWKIAKLKYDEHIKGLAEKKFIGHIDVKFFGMASADGQKSISGEKTKTSEGITKYLPVKYTLKGWVENMISYLRSAMSYTDCLFLDEFIGSPTLIVNSISEIQAVNK